MTTCMKSHEGQIAVTLDLADLLAIAAKLQVFEFDLIVSLLPGPLESFGPRLVAEPVADEVCVTLYRHVNTSSLT